MIRQELIHPVISHFPIVLLTLLPLVYLYHCFKSKEETLFLYRFCLYLGPLFFFMSLFTGDEAMEIIKPKFCHLLEVYAHEQSAHEALIALIIAIALDSTFYFKKLRPYQTLLKISVGASFLVIAFLIVRTSHQGAMLVYDRGAAVLSATCTP